MEGVLILGMKEDLKFAEGRDKAERMLMKKRYNINEVKIGIFNKHWVR